MILAILLLLSGLTISAVAIYYSVAGLVAIFSAAAIPIMVMGISLEVGKLVIASWVKARWQQVPMLMRGYAIFAVIILMVITSLGIFGFLSKAHSDQTLVSGDVQSKIAIYDEKIKTSKDNIDANRKALKQMDEAVDQVMGRSSDEKGAEKAVGIRRGQQKERTRLQSEIASEQKTIAAISEERAPIAAEVRKVEAEVGPIKYIAAFIYGDNPDANLLERAVTWVIILIVIVFDPLAIVMLLAAQMTFGWVRQEKEAKYEPDDGPLTVDQITQLKETVELFEEPIEPAQVETAETLDVDAEVNDPIKCYKCYTPLADAPGIGLFCPNKECDVSDNTKGEEPIELVIHWPEVPNVENKIVEPIVQEPIGTTTQGNPESVGFLKQHTLTIREHVEEPVVEENIVNSDTPNFEGFKDTTTGEWVQTGPAFDEIPGSDDTELVPFKKSTGGYVEYEGKKMSSEVLRQIRPDLAMHADDSLLPKTSFGPNFPALAQIGEQFVRVDVIPNRLFKFNGSKWIEQKRESTDVHLANEGYIKHLIEKLESGEYDPDLLTSNEQDAVAQYILNRS
jgi:hypothetical protein